MSPQCEGIKKKNLTGLIFNLQSQLCYVYHILFLTEMNYILHDHSNSLQNLQNKKTCLQPGLLFQFVFAARLLERCSISINIKPHASYYNKHT